MAQSTITTLSRYNYYTSEPQAEVLFFTTANLVNGHITSNGRVIAIQTQRLNPDILSATFSARELRVGKNELVFHFPEGRQKLQIKAVVEKYAPKSNEVKIDRLTSGLIVNGLPFFPFGFYAYSPLQPTLLEEEAVRGFNVVSPYQKIETTNRFERKAYMDRAAQLGMKVHYNLLSVAGGGGVGGNDVGFNDPLKRRLLRQEIEAFKEHPALLAWYISDEPTGQGVENKVLEEIYQFIKEIDPYHPITMVFNETIRPIEYAKAMDVVMADPYPIPKENVSQVKDFTQTLKQTFGMNKPVWIVPQAFGGGEWWQREPTKQELRVMTYLAIIQGATGIQYFIRHGLSAFPKSLDTWNEAGEIAHEVAELTPWLASATKPKVMASPSPIQVEAWQEKDAIVVLAVNTENEPQMVTLEFPQLKMNEQAEVLFTNRKTHVRNGVWSDMIDGFGTRAYRIRLKPTIHKAALLPQNLVTNPSFEQNPMPSTPEGFYINIDKERATTIATDARTAVHGWNSLRINSPRLNANTSLAFYPIEMQRGKSYVASIWAKGDAQVSAQRGQFQFGIGETVNTFPLTNEWQQVRFNYTLPNNAAEIVRAIPSLNLQAQGSAWFDALQIVPDPNLDVLADVRAQTLSVVASSILENAELYYTTDGSLPTKNASRYTKPILIERSGTLKVAAFVNGEKQTTTQRTFHLHQALLKPATYTRPFSPKYTGGGAFALVDGEKASDQFRDPHWQGIEEDDLSMTVDLGSVRPINKISANFLQDLNVWIFLPTQIAFYASIDGQNFREISKLDNAIPTTQKGSFMQTFGTEIPSEARYIRMVARNIGECPETHAAKGNKAWLFVDELIVE